MPKDQFRFKQFTIRQDRCVMKVGTDSVLLGAWTNYAHAQHILDIGTGTGVLALIAAQRQPTALIEAVDIDAAAAAQAAENMATSPWSQRLHAIHADVRTWTHPAQYDLQLSNPPFYKGHQPPVDRRRASARHEVTLRMAELWAAMADRSTPEGRISLIVPFDRSDETIAIARRYGFRPQRTCLVHYMAHKPPKRVLLDLGRTTDSAEQRSVLVVQYRPGEYTEDYKALLSDLELHF